MNDETDTERHRVSVAVWDVPSPTRASQFEIHVGVKCAGGCNLGGQQIEIRDAAGTALCHAVLGSTPRPGTEALYETKLRLLAPDELDVFPRTVHFIGGGYGV